MEYRISIHSITNEQPPEKTLFNAKVEGWSKRINSPGKMVFRVPKTDTTIDVDVDLQSQKRVTLWRKERRAGLVFERVWHGYILSRNLIGDEHQVICVGMLQLLEDRPTPAAWAMNGEGSVEAEALLDEINGEFDTGITFGTGDVTTTQDVVADEITTLAALESLARAHNAEFEVDDLGQLNFVESLGTDKTAITLQFRRDGAENNNVRDFEDGEDGESLATRIIGFNDTLTSTQDSAAPIMNKYGLLVDKVRIDEANDQPTLDAITASILAQREKPASANKIIPLPVAQIFNTVTGARQVIGLQYEDFQLGDLYTFDIVTEQRDEEGITRRIAEIEVQVDEESADEIIILTLSEAGVFITANLVDLSQPREIKRRVKQLEALV